jgi:dihydroorotase
VALVRQARDEGLGVTCDVSINSLHLTDTDIGYFDSRARLNPPLRQQRDRDAIRAALADGTIDALVSDHTPVGEDAKHLPFAEAEPGATGLELLLGSALKWGSASKLSLAQTLSTVTSRPAAVLARSGSTTVPPAGALEEGALADLCVFAAEEWWTVDGTTLASRSHHTPFAQHEMPGRVRCTLVAGALAFDAAE